MASYQQTGDRVATDETSNLIAASKVEGTTVYNRQGENIGSIYDIMIDKRSGNVSYAIMSFGGFLGIGEDYHPLPWQKLRYDTGLGGYVIDETADRLRAAPTLSSRNEADWDPAWNRRVNDYYGVPV